MLRFHTLFQNDHRPLYRGKCFLQFERSELAEHRGKRTVVLRIAKIVEIAEAENRIPNPMAPYPREGDLVCVPRRGPGSRTEPWVPWWVDVDSEKRSSGQASCLRVLFEDEGTPGEANAPGRD